MARYDEEEMYSILPSDNIQCRTCVNRMRDGIIVKERYKFVECDVYEQKPVEILWESARCDYYRKEEGQ